METGLEWELVPSTEQGHCKYGDQSRDLSKVVIYKDQRSRKLQVWRPELKSKNMARQGKASPCGHPTDHRDHWTHWIQINLAQPSKRPPL